MMTIDENDGGSGLRKQESWPLHYLIIKMATHGAMANLGLSQTQKEGDIRI